MQYSGRRAGPVNPDFEIIDYKRVWRGSKLLMTGVGSASAGTSGAAGSIADGLHA